MQILSAPFCLLSQGVHCKFTSQTRGAGDAVGADSDQQAEGSQLATIPDAKESVEKSTIDVSAIDHDLVAHMRSSCKVLTSRHLPTVQDWLKLIMKVLQFFSRLVAWLCSEEIAPLLHIDVIIPTEAMRVAKAESKRRLCGLSTDNHSH